MAEERLDKRRYLEPAVIARLDNMALRASSAAAGAMVAEPVLEQRQDERHGRDGQAGLGRQVQVSQVSQASQVKRRSGEPLPRTRGAGSPPPSLGEGLG